MCPTKCFFKEKFSNEMSKYNNAIISVCVILNVHIEYIYKMFVTKHYTAIPIQLNSVLLVVNTR